MNTENQTPTATEIKKVVTKGQIEVSRVFKGKFQKEGTETAELKQTIDTQSFYPSKTVTSNFQDNPFANEDFNFGEAEWKNSETRVAWINVPEGTTVETVVAKLKSHPKAGLYKVMSNSPIISDIQEYAINQNLTSADIIGDSQVVRYPKGDKNEGKLILSNGKPQYRAVFFNTQGLGDQDSRTAVPSEFYATEAVQMELSNTNVPSQTVL